MDFDGVSLDAAPVQALTDDQLETQLVTWAGRVNAGQARLLALIGEINVRSAWSGDGWLSCTHWLTVKLGMGQATAYEHVRVAHAFREAGDGDRRGLTAERAPQALPSPPAPAPYSLDQNRACMAQGLFSLTRPWRFVTKNHHTT